MREGTVVTDGSKVGVVVDMDSTPGQHAHVLWEPLIYGMVTLESFDDVKAVPLPVRA
jgi:hypothetical protein